MCHACTPLISHTAGVRVDRAAPCRGRRHRRQRTGLCTRAPHVRCCRHGASPRAEHDGGLGCALCAMSGVCLHGVVVHTAIYLHRTRVHTPHSRTFGVVMLIWVAKINITNPNVRKSDSKDKIYLLSGSKQIGFRPTFYPSRCPD